jgi:hypothetical protein
VATAPIVCIHPYGFAVFQLDVHVDREYAIEQESGPGVTVHADDGERLGDVFPGQWFRFTTPGTRWLVDLPTDTTASTRAITLRERPRTPDAGTFAHFQRGPGEWTDLAA